MHGGRPPCARVNKLINKSWKVQKDGKMSPRVTNSNTIRVDQVAKMSITIMLATDNARHYHRPLFPLDWVKVNVATCIITYQKIKLKIEYTIIIMNHTKSYNLIIILICSTFN